MTSEETINQAIGAEVDPQKQIVKYSPDAAALAEMKARFAGLDAVKDYDGTKAAIAELRSCRTKVEASRVAMKSQALEYGRLVDSKAKEVTAQIVAIEAPLKASKQAVDDKAEAEARAIVRAEMEKKAAEEKAAKDKEEAERAEERRKLAEERAELDRQRREQEAERKAIQDKIDAKRAEEDRERKEKQDKLDAEHRAAFAKIQEDREKLAAEQRKVQAEQAAIEKSRKDEEDRKRAAEDAENDRLERIAWQEKEAKRLKAEAEAKAERDRFAEIERKKEEAAELARLEAAKPDVEKIKAFGRSLEALPDPVVKSQEAVKFLAEINDRLDFIITSCKEFKLAKRPAKVKEAQS